VGNYLFGILLVYISETPTLPKMEKCKMRHTKQYYEDRITVFNAIIEKDRTLKELLTIIKDYDTLKPILSELLEYGAIKYEKAPRTPPKRGRKPLGAPPKAFKGRRKKIYCYNRDFDEVDWEALAEDPYYILLSQEEDSEIINEQREMLQKSYIKEQLLRAELLAPLSPSEEKVYDERGKMLDSLLGYLKGRTFAFEKLRHRVIRDQINSDRVGKTMNPETHQIEEVTFQEYEEKCLIWNFRDLLSKPWEDLSELEKLVFLFFHYWDFQNPIPFYRNPQRIFSGSALSGLKLHRSI
jgi:hypothetical protein